MAGASISKAFLIKELVMIDRDFQISLLSELAGIYPSFMNFQKKYGDDRKALANIMYLMEHGLLTESSILESLSLGKLDTYQLNYGRINHHGLDFLADDGGLKAILNVTTVKFETETLKALLLEKVANSDLSQSDKQKLSDELKELRSESIKHLTTKVLDMGFDNLPSLLPLIQSIVN